MDFLILISMSERILNHDQNQTWSLRHLGLGHPADHANRLDPAFSLVDPHISV